jgi:hypothetical protein
MAERAARHAMLERIIAQPEMAAELTSAVPVPPDVSDWLASLGLLIGLPFAYLVPDARMLPPESVRFFCVDPNWQAALLDGVLSIGATSGAAGAVTALRRAAFHAAASPADENAAGPVTGMLLRSAAVSDWPGLQINGYSDATGNTPLPVTRFERVAAGVLLVLFTGLVARVDITEPPQHLHFGVGAATAPFVSLRYIDADRAGSQVAGDPTCPLAIRDDEARTVLDVAASRSALASALGEAYTPATPPALGSAALALQFLTTAQTQSFTSAVAAAAVEP